jgi:uncharacterized protein (DUF433 family)
MDRIEQHPDLHSGDSCFRGTRVPVGTQYSILADGGTLEEFLKGYPTVNPADAAALAAQRDADAAAWMALPCDERTRIRFSLPLPAGEHFRMDRHADGSWYIQPIASPAPVRPSGRPLSRPPRPVIVALWSPTRTPPPSLVLRADRPMLHAARMVGPLGNSKHR